MSYDQSKWELLSKKKSVFSGWYVDNVQPSDSAPYFSPYLRNARVEGQSIVIRPWHILLTDSLTAWGYSRGISSYLRADGANDRMIVRHNISGTQKLYLMTETWALTAITTGANITSDNRSFFLNVWDVIYHMNGVDDYGKLDGTTYTLPTTGLTNFSPTFAVVFNGSAFASGRSDNSNIVYKSVWDDYEDFAGTWSDTLTFQENITGLWSSDQALYYFTANSVSVTGQSDIQSNDTGGGVVLSYITRPLDTLEWAVNHASIATRGNKVFCVTPSNKIVFFQPWQSFDGKDTIPLSHRAYSGIDNLMATLDKDQSDCFAYKLPTENLIKRFFKSQGSTINDICIVYNVELDVFLPDTGKYFYDWVHYKGKNYTVSMIEPKVFRDEYAYDDEDAPIPFEYWTKYFYLWGTTRKTVIRGARTLIDINQLAKLTQSIIVDGRERDMECILWIDIVDESGGLWTFWVWTESIGAWWVDDDNMVEYARIRTKWDLNFKGRRVQVRYKNTTVGGQVRLKDLTLRSERLPDLANNT